MFSFERIDKDSYVAISNISINLNASSEKISRKLYLFENLNVSKYIAQAQAKNIIVKANFSINNKELYMRQFDIKDVRDIVVVSKGISYYYGEDFKNFHYSWKTGEIFLASTNATIFEGVVDEKYLQGKGISKLIY